MSEKITLGSIIFASIISFFTIYSAIKSRNMINPQPMQLTQGEVNTVFYKQCQETLSRDLCECIHDEIKSNHNDNEFINILKNDEPPLRRAVLLCINKENHGSI